jgi:hypothetical protein
MSQLSWDTSVTTDESIALGGWTTHSNRDYYVWTYLVSVIPPALSLAGYPDARVIPTLPHSGKLFHHGEPRQRMTADQHNSLIRNLFVIDLPEFQYPAGRLRALLVSVTASMIMHFDYVYHKYTGRHQYVQKMINASLQARIGGNSQECIIKLKFWSTPLHGRLP